MRSVPSSFFACIRFAGLGLALLGLVSLSGCINIGGTARTLSVNSGNALQELKATDPVAAELADDASGVLVFPSIAKAGFLIAAQTGEGVLYEAGRATAFYNTTAASYGLQAGVQKFGYALFFMDDASLDAFKASSGFEIGLGPSVVIVDSGFAARATNLTVRKGIYAVTFDQKGLMAGIGLEGSKITRIEK